MRTTADTDALPAAGGAIEDEARPRRETLDLFAKVHARLDGKPAFWLSRGREYGFIEGRYERGGCDARGARRPRG